MKDLTIFDHDLRRIVLVDDNPENFRANPRNGIPVIPFLGPRGSNKVNPNKEVDAQSLPYVTKVLHQIAELEDVRPYLEDRFRIEKLFQASEQLFTAEEQVSVAEEKRREHVLVAMVMQLRKELSSEMTWSSQAVEMELPVILCRDVELYRGKPLTGASFATKRELVSDEGESMRRVNADAPVTTSMIAKESAGSSSHLEKTLSTFFTVRCIDV